MDDYCHTCGGEIVFRYQGGVLTPIHLTGGCATTYLPETRSSSYQDDFCRPTTCSYCGADIFFVRHNGGSVWFDDLRWPWPKHACYYSEDKAAALLFPSRFFDKLGPESALYLVIFCEQVAAKRTRLTVKGHKGRYLHIITPGNQLGLSGDLVTVSEDGAFLVALSDPRRRIMIVESTDLGFE